jgi:signal transduction histidine kinase
MSDPSFNVLRRRLRLGRPADGSPSESAHGEPPGGGVARTDAEQLLEALAFGTLMLDAARSVSAVNDRLCALLALDHAFFRQGESFASLARRASLGGESCLLGIGMLLDSAPQRREPHRCEIATAKGVALTVQAFLRPDGGFILGFAPSTGNNAADRGTIAAEVLDSIPGAAIRCEQDTDGAQRIVFASRNVVDMLGVDAATLAGNRTDLLSFVEAADAVALAGAVHASFTEGVGIDVNIHVRNAHGGEHLIRCQGHAQRTAHGTAVWDARLADVGARLRAEAERKRLQTLLDEVVENIPHIVTVRDVRDMSYCLLNRTAEEYMGVPRATLIGKPRGRLLDGAASDIRERLTQRLIETGVPVEMPEMETDTATYGRRILRGRKFPLFGDHGNVEYVLTINEDLTGRREREKALQRSEQRLREAIEGFTDGLALFDVEDRLVLCNRRFREMWPGIAELACPGVSYADLVRAVVRAGGLDRPIQDIDAYVAARVNRHRNPPTTSEHKLTGGRWLNVTHRTTAEGGISVTCTDITALKEREERLRHAGHEAVRAKEAAEEANRSKSVFLANMSHELRTPLNAVIGFSEIIKDAMLGENRLDDYRGYARDIHESGKHLLELINDILDMSKIEAGKLELFEETLDIVEVIEPCLKLVRERALRSGIEMKTEIPDGLPLIRGDIRKLKQILINLLTNSVKFTPTGGCVNVATLVAPNGDFVLRVADTGPGIRTEDIERALEPFSQIESGPARAHEGTGLGLALTKALTELHGGQIRIDARCDKPPTGTTVSVTLPARRVIDRAAGQA